MVVKTLRERLNREPFEPFRITSSSGVSIVVHSPGLAVLMKSEVFVASPNSDHWVQIPYLRVAAVEPAQNGHGRAAQRRKPRRRRGP